MEFDKTDSDFGAELAYFSYRCHAAAAERCSSSSVSDRKKNHFESTQLSAASLRLRSQLVCAGAATLCLYFLSGGGHHVQGALSFIFYLVRTYRLVYRQTWRHTERCKTSKPQNIYPCDLRLEMPPE